MRKLFLLVAIYLLLTTPALAQSVDLLSQGQSYTPPFYQGASLWSKQGLVTLLAVPKGLGNPKALNYRWTKNGTVLGGEGGASGVGRNSLTFSDTIFSKPVTIQVEILNPNEDVLTENSLTLAPENPLLIVYENNPLYGLMFHQEITGAYQLPSGEVTFTAFPFFFDAESRLSANLNYRWTTNAGEAETRNSATYRAPETGSGSSSVSVNLSSPDKLMSAIGQSFLVQFGHE